MIVMMVVKQTQLHRASSRTSAFFCHLNIGISKGRMQEALYRLNDLRGVEVKKA